jgi:hypothetical protein
MEYIDVGDSQPKRLVANPSRLLLVWEASTRYVAVGREFVTKQR